MKLKFIFTIPFFLSLLICSCEPQNNLKSISDGTKQKFIQLLGDIPYRREIRIRELLTEEFEKFVRKLVQYEISDDTVEAYILIPKGIKSKVPGILAIHQDGAHRPYEYGKGEPAGVKGDTSLFYGLELCLRGFVVICPDRFGFESRMLTRTRYWKDFSTFPVSLEYNGEKIDLTEDLYKGAKSSQLLTEGRTMLGMTLTELMYAIDILCSLNEVDTSKIGVIGHSAGGFLSSILMYVDDRIDVGCSSCGSLLISDIYNDTYLRPMNGFCGLLTVPGLKKWGDFDDVIEGIYPRAFLELSADIDRSKVFEKAMKKQIEGEVKRKIDQKFYNLGKHTFSKSMREEAYTMLESNLYRR
jgi:dienelactone hydrolase